MLRIRFVKEGNAVWISHLDLMRLLQRAFRRAGLMLKHSQGYSPHPELSIVMPLSVGVSSDCELADFELEEGCDVPAGEIPARINSVMPEGIRVLDCCEGGQKAGKLALLRSRLELAYDSGLPCGAEEALRALFARPSISVEKHSKKGPVEVDIEPMIREVHVRAANRPQADAIEIEVVGAAQNPTLNPLLLVTAIETYLPQYKPDFVTCRRLEVYDGDMKPFR